MEGLILKWMYTWRYDMHWINVREVGS